jgi:phenylpyruvate tautomerase PptA (4-oxalocrotonate tautomerase family)
MPIINVKVYEGRLNAETEPKLIAGMTQSSTLRRGHARATSSRDRRAVGRRRQGA